MCPIVSLANALTSVKHLVEKQWFCKPSCTIFRSSANIDFSWLHSLLTLVPSREQTKEQMSLCRLRSPFLIWLFSIQCWEAKTEPCSSCYWYFTQKVTKLLNHLRLLMQTSRIDPLLILWIIRHLLFSLLICYLCISVCECECVCIYVCVCVSAILCARTKRMSVKEQLFIYVAIY